MALNFPVPTAVGETYTDPATGNLYTCLVVGPPAVWITGDGTSPDPDNFVTIDTSQTITGKKLFEPGLDIGGALGTPNTALNADGSISIGGTIPASPNISLNATDGSATFAGNITTTGNVITSDLVMNNTHKAGGNEVDGTSGHWAIQEGEDSLYVINRLSGKRYAMALTPC